MATRKGTVDFILGALRPARFSARAMFGEYALYAGDKVVALICDDQLYVKILPASAALEGVCEKDSPYPGAKAHYLVEEGRLARMEELGQILLDVAKSLPAKKPKSVKKKPAAKKKRQFPQG